MAALRVVIESAGGYTVVEGETLPMLPGDLVLTPSWTWHDHANDSDAPMMWLESPRPGRAGGIRTPRRAPRSTRARLGVTATRSMA
jgi:hypothetical protein